MSEKRYFWLKLYDDFFTSKRIKKLRSIAGGDTYTIIYLKMQLKALKTEGYLYFDGVMTDFAEELALDLDENPDDVRVTIQFLLSVGLLETNNEEAYKLTYLQNVIGSESASAQRGKEYRARLTDEQKEKERERARLGMQKTRANRRDVTDSYERVTNVEIEKEIDIEIDIEKEKNIPAKESKHTYGEYNHVKLTDKEYNNLCNDYGEFETKRAIQFLDEYIEMKGYKAKSHYLCIKKWVFNAVKEQDQKKKPPEQNRGNRFLNA